MWINSKHSLLMLIRELKHSQQNLPMLLIKMYKISFDILPLNSMMRKQISLLELTLLQKWLVLLTELVLAVVQQVPEQ